MKSSPCVMLFLWLGLVWKHHGVEAYSGGAGACPGGIPAVGSTHLTNSPVVNTSLADQSASLQLQGVTLTPGVKAFFNAGTVYNVEVVSTTSTIKGCLIRFSVPTGTGKDIMTVTPGTNLQAASACDSETDAVGVTHMDSTAKSSCACTFELSTASAVTMDITIVITNTAAGSTYAYNQFVGGGSTPAPTVPATPGGTDSATDVTTGSVAPASAPVPLVGGPSTVTPPTPAEPTPLVGGPSTVTPPGTTPAPSMSGTSEVSDLMTDETTGSVAPATAPVRLVGGPSTVTPPTLDEPTRLVGGPSTVTPPIVDQPTTPTTLGENLPPRAPTPLLPPALTPLLPPAFAPTSSADASSISCRYLLLLLASTLSMCLLL